MEVICVIARFNQAMNEFNSSLMNAEMKLRFYVFRFTNADSIEERDGWHPYEIMESNIRNLTILVVNTIRSSNSSNSTFLI